MRQRWEILDGRGFGRAFAVVVGWMLLATLLFWMVVSTSITLRKTWARGPDTLSPLSHSMPEEDFANLWAAGHLVRAGQLDALYSARRFQAWRQAHFGREVFEEGWLYPPTVLLLGVPLSFLPLFAGFLFWDAMTLLGAVLLLRHARLPWPILLVGLAGPATWRALALGQYAVITGALVVAGLLLAPVRPWRAGIMLGLVTMKPQQGMVVPVAWLAARNGRAILAAAGTFLVLALAVTVWLGGHAWALFLANSSTMTRALLDAPPPQPVMNFGLSMFWMLRSFGASIAVANLGQIAAGLLASGLVYRAMRVPGAAPLARMGAVACLSLLIPPYGYTSDMVAYSLALAVTLAGKGWRLSAVDVLLWTWPFYCTIVSIHTGWLLTPIFVAVAAARCWRQMVPPPALAPATAPVRPRWSALRSRSAGR